jgi:hypothetical protein
MENVILKFYNKQGLVFDYKIENKGVDYNYFILKDLIIEKYSDDIYFINIETNNNEKVIKLKRIIKNFINENTLLGTSKILNNNLYTRFEKFN